jgi:hypothetical protein
MNLRLLLIFFAMRIAICNVDARNVFPASGNTGIGAVNPPAVLHLHTVGEAAYPSTTTKGNILQPLQADSNGLEIGVANAINSRRARL